MREDELHERARILGNRATLVSLYEDPGGFPPALNLVRLKDNGHRDRKHEPDEHEQGQR